MVFLFAQHVAITVCLNERDRGKKEKIKERGEKVLPKGGENVDHKASADGRGQSNSCFQILREKNANEEERIKKRGKSSKAKKQTSTAAAIPQAENTIKRVTTK